jgi:hypothetical protein
VVFLQGSWPWWLGAFCLTSVCLSYPLLLRRLCSLSGFWVAVVQWSEQRRAARAEAAMNADGEATRRAMYEAALAELGGEIPPELEAQLGDLAEPEQTPDGAASPRHLHPGAYLALLAGLGLGGLLAAVARGELAVEWSMGATYGAIFGNGPLAWLALVGGGFLLGFGARMSGGCTMGHGLSGCARLQPGSLIATATFMAVAIAVSLLLGRLA